MMSHQMVVHTQYKNVPLTLTWIDDCSYYATRSSKIMRSSLKVTDRNVGSVLISWLYLLSTCTSRRPGNRPSRHCDFMICGFNKKSMALWFRAHFYDAHHCFLT